MAEHEFTRALGYANAAVDLLKRAGIPPYPQYYELFYTYATGTNPVLNARLNSLFKSGVKTDSSFAETLYNEFLRSGDVNDRLSSVSERMHEKIEAVHHAIESAMRSAHDYGGSLEAASGDLSATDVAPEMLRTMAARLLAETRQMQQTNEQLERQLEASRDGIASLQADLDQVRKESLLDPLTQISNRKSFDQGMAAAFGQAVEAGEPLSIIMLDIDHFKIFNDTYGHPTGDQVLRLVAMTLKSNIKGKDIAARYGGEEFVVVLPTTDLEGAVILAENIRRAIQAKELLKRSTNEKLGRITASFGVAHLCPGDTVATMVERADRCLYAAKHAGRNRVVSETEMAQTIQAA